MSVFKIHPSADVQTKKIGKNSIVWQYTIVLSGAKIGENCNINAHCFIENDVVIGNNVTIKSGVYLWNGIHIKDDVFVGPNVTFTNDLYPRSKVYPDKFLKTTIKKGASIGAGAVLLAGITVGEYSMIGAGSVVTKDIPDYNLCLGNPAKFKAYVCGCGMIIGEDLVCNSCKKKYQMKDGKVIEKK